MPEVKFIFIAAVSLDGKIGRNPNETSTVWTSQEDKKFLNDILNKIQVIVIGRKTYEIAIKPLSKRRCIVLTSQVEKIQQKSDLCYFFNPDAVNLKVFISELGFSQAAVLGGTKTYDTLLSQGFIDEIYLTIEPIIFGAGLSLFSKKLSILKNLKLDYVKKMNEDGSILLHYFLTNQP